MEHHLEVAPSQASRANDDSPCWSRIGVRGDRSCQELRLYVHCRNCPVYSEAARALLDHEALPEYISEWTRHYARPRSPEGSMGQIGPMGPIGSLANAALATQPIIIFRVGPEWLALPAGVVIEVTEHRPIHSLPHRRDGVVLGLVNVRGELLPCVSLGQILEIDSSSDVDRGRPPQRQERRLLVTRRGEARIVFPVDHVHGMHRIDEHDRHELPATVAKDSSTYSKAIVSWRDNSVGLLDDEQLFSALRRSLA